MDMKLEVVVVPVSDVDKAKDFYQGLGWRLRASGLAPNHQSYGSFVSFSDPDGNGWFVQEVTNPPSGPVRPMSATYDSATEPAEALRRAAAAQGAST